DRKRAGAADIDRVAVDLIVAVARQRAPRQDEEPVAVAGGNRTAEAQCPQPSRIVHLEAGIVIEGGAIDDRYGRAGGAVVENRDSGGAGIACPVVGGCRLADNACDTRRSERGECDTGTVIIRNYRSGNGNS